MYCAIWDLRGIILNDDVQTVLKIMSTHIFFAKRFAQKMPAPGTNVEIKYFREKNYHFEC
jgi:hypothetical protein